MSLLSLQGVQAFYGASQALFGVDLAVEDGEVVALMGRNGMGKTTTIGSILGLVRPRGGAIKFAGKEIAGLPPHRIAQLGLGLVPEGRRCFPNLTVEENLLVAARGSDWTLARVLDMFPRLEERIDNAGAQLSGGEQQMLSIGRALMTNPDLVILDEATEGLAPLVVAEIWRVLAGIRETGIAALVVDRDYRRVADHSNRLVVLQKGRVVLEGEAGALAGQPASLEAMTQATRDAGADLEPINSDIHASADYRRAMIGVFVRRAVMAASRRK